MNAALSGTGAFTCGDQLLWGAAEPLRRMLRILQSAGSASRTAGSASRADVLGGTRPTYA